MKHEIALWLLVLVPVLSGGIIWLFSSPRTILRVMLGGVFLSSALILHAVWQVFTKGPAFSCADWLHLDALSAFHLSVMLLVFFLSSLFAYVYFGTEIRAGRLRTLQARLFGSLWCETLAAMTLVLVSNNLGIMWVGVEATTLATAFLICIHVSREALEAMWKYLLICSVGIAFALLGLFLVVASAHNSGLSGNEALIWTKLNANASALDPDLMKAAFIFILIGFGTKAGLAPMHNWLPDAHSKAPSPVSAIFSGFMLTTAMYCIIRYIPIVEAATGGSGWSLNLLVLFGLLSIILAAAFILFQRDIKRLAAYSSIEHLGIIALGFGLGGLGTLAALFHTLNHSICKSLLFFSAGRLGQFYGSHEMERMPGGMKVSPIWGAGLFGSLLALIGVCPFALFMSKLQIFSAAVEQERFIVLTLFLLGAGIVFIGALKHAIPLAWGKPPAQIAHSIRPQVLKPSILEKFLVIVPLALLLILGVWMPEPLLAVLTDASAIIQGSSSGETTGLIAGIRL